MNKSLYKNIEDNDFNLSYYLLEDENTNVYGIEVEKTEDSQVQESKAIYDISTNKSNVDSLLDKISNGRVTPTTLYDIVTDYIND